MSLRSAPTTRPAHTWSAVSNGRRLFVVGDGKTEWARRYRDIYEAHISDAGGADLLSEAQLQLCRRAASLAIEAERMEGELPLASMRARRRISGEGAPMAPEFS